MQNNPAGNSKHFCKSVKFLNGKRASTIPVTHHGQTINYSRREQKADTFNHFFQSCAWIVITATFIGEMDYKCNSLCNPWIVYSSGIKWGPRLWGSWDYCFSNSTTRYKQTCKTLCISLILNNTWSMPVQSGIHPQLRTMTLLRMCKVLPVEYLSKCGTVSVLRCCLKLGWERIIDWNFGNKRLE